MKLRFIHALTSGTQFHCTRRYYSYVLVFASHLPLARGIRAKTKSEHIFRLIFKLMANLWKRFNEKVTTPWVRSVSLWCSIANSNILLIRCAELILTGASNHLDEVGHGKMLHSLYLSVQSPPPTFSLSLHPLFTSLVHGKKLRASPLNDAITRYVCAFVRDFFSKPHVSCIRSSFLFRSGCWTTAPSRLTATWTNICRSSSRNDSTERRKLSCKESRKCALDNQASWSAAVSQQWQQLWTFVCRECLSSVSTLNVLDQTG